MNECENWPKPIISQVYCYTFGRVRRTTHFNTTQKNHLSVVYNAIHCNNAEYLRGLITDNPGFARTYQYIIYGECIMRGRIDCVRAAQECGLQITQTALLRALEICRSDEVKAMFAQ
jgi:hypothetical protein